MRHRHKIILVCLLIALSVAAFSCNTVEGMGRDIERTGEAIQDAFD